MEHEQIQMRDVLWSGMYWYSIVTIFLFIYAMPYLFVGFGPVFEGGLVAATANLINMANREELHFFTRCALWFARQRTFRKILAVGLFLLVTCLSGVIKSQIIRNRMYMIVSWFNLGIFSTNFLGMVFLLL